jgi:hypothetical protein
LIDLQAQQHKPAQQHAGFFSSTPAAFSLPAIARADNNGKLRATIRDDAPGTSRRFFPLVQVTAG